MASRARRIARGAGWIYSYRWIDRLLGLLSLAVLARILTPEDFGLVAIAASVVSIVEGLSEFEVRQALIQSRDEDRRLYDTAWTLSAIRGLAAAGIMASAAPFFGDSQITGVLFALAVVPLLDGLANPRFVLFERELVYSRLAAQTLIATFLSLAVTLSVAVVYRSYWALVLGTVVRSLVSLIASFALKPYRPSLTLLRWREILTFSVWMSLANAVATLSMRTDRIIVGRLLGYADAGSYYMTQRVGVLPTSELIGPLQRILFPSFSQIAADPGRLRRAVCQSVNALASLSLPAAVGFALVANDVVPLVLGEKWVSIAPLLVVLVPFLGLRSALLSARSCVMALGRTRLMFRVSLTYAVVHLPVFILATALYGLKGAIWSIVAVGFFYNYLSSWLLEQTLGITLREILGELRRPLLATAVMTAAILIANVMLPVDLFSPRGSWLSLLVKVGVGAIVSCATLYALWRHEGRPEGFEQRLLELLLR